MTAKDTHHFAVAREFQNRDLQAIKINLAITREFQKRSMKIIKFLELARLAS